MQLCFARINIFCDRSLLFHLPTHFGVVAPVARYAQLPIIVHYCNPYQLWVFVVDVYGQKTEVSQRVNGNKSYSALYLSYCDLVIQLLLYALLSLWKLQTNVVTMYLFHHSPDHL